jgi:DNA topoisomerase-2
MAQDFVGSNNVAWLVPQGQFGTRLEGGKDSASPRYIHTYLQPYVSALVPSDDFDCLNYRDDDGVSVEPDWYCPVLPMILINGCRGIGTGYSTFVPSYNPAELKSAILEWLNTGKGLDREFVPYTRGFKGSISKVNAKEFCVKGIWKVEKDMMTVTELPVGTWTSDFRETLEKMVASDIIKDYTDTSTDTDILVKVKLGAAGSAPVEKVLTDKIKLTNMHLFNSDCVIKKYDSPNEILDEFVAVRLDMYGQRREFMLGAMRNKLPYHENVVRFIRQQCEKEPLPDLRRKTPEECDSMLEKQKFARISDSFDYLMNLPIASLTLKNATKHERDLEELREKIKALESTTPKQMWKTELEKLRAI